MLDTHSQTGYSLPMTQTTAVVVGDFFYSSWGYDQTNVDFYKVVGLTKSGKSVRVQPWTASQVTGEHSAVVPGDGPAMVQDYTGVDRNADWWTRREQVVTRPSQVVTKRLSDSGRPAFRVNSFAHAFLHSPGSSHYVTPHGMGH